MYYAQITHGIVTSVTETAGLLQESAEAIRLDTFDTSILGCAYADGVFTPVAPVVAPQRKLTKLEYMNRFTDSELAAIYGAAKVSPAVEVWLKKFEATTPDADGKAIDLDDPRTIAGLQALEAATLLGAGRAAEILA